MREKKRGKYSECKKHVCTFLFSFLSFFLFFEGRFKVGFSSFFCLVKYCIALKMFYNNHSRRTKERTISFIPLLIFSLYSLADEWVIFFFNIFTLFFFSSLFLQGSACNFFFLFYKHKYRNVCICILIILLQIMNNYNNYIPICNNNLIKLEKRRVNKQGKKRCIN